MQKIKATFTISDFVINELDAISETLNQKKSHIVEKALSLYFDSLDELVADKRLEEAKKNNIKPIPANEVWEELGI